MKISYFNYSKNILISIISIFPFIVLYEIICFSYFKNTNYQIRNSADVIIRDFFSYFGNYSDIAYSLSLAATLIFIFYIKKNSNSVFKIKYNYLGLMLFEGLLFGCILLLLLNDNSIFVLNSLTYQNHLLLNLYLCIGAGVWEEILFRVILFSLLYNFISYINKGKYDYINLFFAVILSSVLFSLFHYIGVNADSYNISSFIIRFIGGVFLSVIYFYRGFGIASISHISYDFILVSLPLIYIN